MRKRISVPQWVNMRAYVGIDTVTEEDGKFFVVTPNAHGLSSLVDAAVSGLRRTPEPSPTLQARRNAVVRSLAAVSKKLRQEEK